ncbi:hypothetical protein D3C72_2239800 [compost metagenome]
MLSPNPGPAAGTPQLALRGFCVWDQSQSAAGYSNGSVGVGWVGRGMRGRGASRLAAFSRKLARITAA